MTNQRQRAPHRRAAREHLRRLILLWAAMALALATGPALAGPAAATPQLARQASPSADDPAGADDTANADGTATAASASTLTWSVRPTPTDTAPERPNFAFEVEGGDTIADSIRVRNFGTDALELSIYASDALITASGALDLLPAGATPVDVGAWIRLEASSLIVEPGEFLDVPFTMTVPENAAAGDHTGGIVTSIATPAKDDTGQPVVLDRRLGSRVQVRVGGELRPELVVTALSTSYAGSPNPLGGGTVRVSYTIENTGNVRLAADQAVTVKGLLGVGSRRVEPKDVPEVLPGNSVSFSVNIDGVWPAVRSDVQVELKPFATIGADELAALPPAVSRTASVWTFPWAQTVTLAVLVGVPAGIVWNRGRRKWQEETVVRQAVKTAIAQREGWM